MKKKLFIVLGVLLVLGLCFTACSGDDEAEKNVFANTSWQYSGPWSEGGQTFTVTINLSFKTDTWTMVMEAMGQSQTQNGTYKANGNTAILSVAGDPETTTVTIKGNTLTVEGMDIVLTKQQ
jgi:hypothetical protein